MVKRDRIKLGIFYFYNETWIGGTYYIENLIRALNTLDDDRKPFIFVFTNSEKSLVKLNASVTYPYLSSSLLYRHLGYLERLVNFVFRLFTKKNLISNLVPLKYLDIFFPLFGFDSQLVKAVGLDKVIFWIPDFQEHHLPHFFSRNEIEERKKNQKKISKKPVNLILSSQDALNDFNNLYPNSLCRTHVLNFAVSHDIDLRKIDSDEIAKKYGLPKNYFICSNQFWVHKNHIVLLEAIKHLKNEGVNFFVAFTGKNYDHRNLNYFEEIKLFVVRNQLQNHVKFLGFLERHEQLALMKGAIAIIQPSLFEGWSTVVEDAKALSQDLILSDIPVHREQTENYPNKSFFNPHNFENLSDLMKIRLYRSLPPKKFTYEIDVKNYAENFMKIISSIINKSS